VWDFLPPYRSPTGYMIRRTLNWTLLFLTKGKEGNSPANPFKPAAAHTHTHTLAVHLYGIQLLNLHDWCSVQSEHLIKRHLQSGLHVPVTYQYFTTPANTISEAVYNRGPQTQSIHTLFIDIKVLKHVVLLVVVLKESQKTVEVGQSIHLSVRVLVKCWLGVVCALPRRKTHCVESSYLSPVCVFMWSRVCESF